MTSILQRTFLIDHLTPIMLSMYYCYQLLLKCDDIFMEMFKSFLQITYDYMLIMVFVRLNNFRVGFA